MKIIDRILSLMDIAGLTQESLAAELSKSGKMEVIKQTITDWKSGKSNSYYRIVVEIADLFGTTTDYILTGKNNPSSLDKNAEELINILSCLSDERDKNKLIGYAECYAKQLPSYSLHQFDFKQEASNE